MNKKTTAPVALQVPEKTESGTDLIFNQSSDIQAMLDTPAKRTALANMIVPDAPDVIKTAFMVMCKLAGANPLNDEAYCWEQGGKWLYSLGAHYFRNRLSQIDTYSHHVDSAVYRDEKFKKTLDPKTGQYIIDHDGNPFSDSPVVGAYCTIYFKNSVRPPYTVTLNFSEKNKGQSTWKTSPAEMIRTKAIKTACREVYPQEFKGVEKDYIDEAIKDIPVNIGPLPPPPPVELEPDVIEVAVEPMSEVQSFIESKAGKITASDIKSLMEKYTGGVAMKAKAKFQEYTHDMEYKNYADIKPEDLGDMFQYLSGIIKENNYVCP